MMDWFPWIWTKSNFDAVLSRLDRILAQQQALMNELLTKEKNVMAALDDLAAQVRANTNLEQSAITLITGIAQQLADAVSADDSEAITALSEQLKASATSLADAIAANTPQINPLKK